MALWIAIPVWCVMHFRVTLALEDGSNPDLVWRLNERPITQKWATLTRRALLLGHRPTGLQTVVRREQNELDGLRAELRQVARQAAANGYLPEALLDLDLNSQEGLNILHAALHLNERHVPPIMNRLNILVHMIENSERVPRGGYAVVYLADAEGVLSDELSPDDLIEGDAPPSFGALVLGYATVGKSLAHCFFDNDVEAVERGLVRPQRTVSPEVLIEMRPMLTSPDMRRQRFRDWCKRNDVASHGYSWDGTVHGVLFQPTLGTLISPEGLDEDQARRLLASTRAVTGVSFPKH